MYLPKNLANEKFRNQGMTATRIIKQARMPWSWIYRGCEPIIRFTSFIRK